MWWGPFDIAEGQAGRWKIGPLTFSAIHRPGEWRLAHANTGDGVDCHLEVECPLAAAEIVEGGSQLRVVSGEMSGTLELVPLLADRPIMHRPEVTLRIMPEAEVTLFVSSPIWLGVAIGDPPQRLLEVPAWRPSDSWFGPPNRRGELCYATRTKARLNLENLPICPHRTITKILLHNGASSVLEVERINLPMPNLTLYADSDGDLWTQEVRVERDRVGTSVRVDLGKGAPPEARRPQRVARPRDSVQRSLLERALGALLG